MVEIVKYSVVLASVSCLAVLPVSFIHGKTVRRAADGREALLTTALRQVVPGGAAAVGKKVFLQGEYDSTVYWIATSGGDTTYSFTVETCRYPGSSIYVVGIGADGIVKGMYPVGATGPDGRGDMRNPAAKHRKSEEKNKNGGLRFSDQFIGLSVDRPITVCGTPVEWTRLDDDRRQALLAKNEISAIPGAIGSARDIANAVTIKARRLLKMLRS